MPSIVLSAAPAGTRVHPDRPFEGEGRAEIFSARNEVGSAQIVVTARDGALHGVDVEASSLRGTDGTVLPVPLTKLSPADQQWVQQHLSGGAQP